MIVNNENENDIKLINNIENGATENYDSIKFNGKISINELNNNLDLNNLYKSKQSVSSKYDNNETLPFQVLPREKRQALYGIDCISDVVFSKW